MCRPVAKNIYSNILCHRITDYKILYLGDQSDRALKTEYQPIDAFAESGCGCLYQFLFSSFTNQEYSVKMTKAASKTVPRHYLFKLDELQISFDAICLRYLHKVKNDENHAYVSIFRTNNTRYARNCSHFADKALFYQCCLEFHLLYFVMALFATHVLLPDYRVISNLVNI